MKLQQKSTSHSFSRAGGPSWWHLTSNKEVFLLQNFTWWERVGCIHKGENWAACFMGHVICGVHRLLAGVKNLSAYLYPQMCKSFSQLVYALCPKKPFTGIIAFCVFHHHHWGLYCLRGQELFTYPIHIIQSIYAGISFSFFTPIPMQTVPQQ